MAAEKHVEDKIKRGLARSGVYYYKNFASAFTNKGIPDIVGCAKPGYFFAVEVKRVLGGRPTPVQIRNLSLIAKNRGRAFLACGTDVVPMVNLSWNKLGILAQHGLLIAVPVNYTKKLIKLTAKQASVIWHYRPKGCQVVLITKSAIFRKYFSKQKSCKSYNDKLRKSGVIMKSLAKYFE